MQDWAKRNNVVKSALLNMAEKMTSIYRLPGVGRKQKRNVEWVYCWMCDNFDQFIDYTGRHYGYTIGANKASARQDRIVGAPTTRNDDLDWMLFSLDVETAQFNEDNMCIFSG